MRNLKEMGGCLNMRYGRIENHIACASKDVQSALHRKIGQIVDVDGFIGDLAISSTIPKYCSEIRKHQSIYQTKTVKQKKRRGYLKVIAIKCQTLLGRYYHNLFLHRTSLHTRSIGFDIVAHLFLSDSQANEFDSMSSTSALTSSLQILPAD